MAPSVEPREHPRTIGWLGTTAVYGDRQGGWVDEDTPLTPTIDRARRPSS